MGIIIRNCYNEPKLGSRDYREGHYNLFIESRDGHYKPEMGSRDGHVSL